MLEELTANRLDDGVSKEPAASQNSAAAAEEDNDHNGNDDGLIVVFLGFFSRHNRHVRHKLFSLKKMNLTHYIRLIVVCLYVWRATKVLVPPK